MISKKERKSYIYHFGDIVVSVNVKDIEIAQQSEMLPIVEVISPISVSDLQLVFRSHDFFDIATSDDFII